MTSRFKKQQNYNLRVYNAFKFLQNTYKDIREDWFNDINMSEVKTIEDVYVITLCKVINVIAKRGLYKEYIKIEDKELISPKGRIELSKSVIRQTRLKGTLLCSYDELSDNVLHNQLIKTILLHMTKNTNVTKNYIYLIQKVLKDFNGIDIIEIKNINWKRIRYNNSNLRYKTALELSKSLIDIENISKITTYEFEDKLHIMFTKQLYNYYYKEYNNLDYTVNKIVTDKWASNFKYEKLVGKTRTLIAISKDRDTLIIGFERYDSRADRNEEDRQLKQIKQVAEEYKQNNKNLNLKIGLLYINPTAGYTDKDIQIVNVDGMIAGYTTVDCNIGYIYIKYKLNQLVHTILK